VSSPYVGQLLLVGFNFAPAGWATCNGALQSIADNSGLFNLIGTTYGGDGQQTFGLPDLQGRITVHQGNGTTIGERAGVESVTLLTAQLPVHNHPMNATRTGGSQNSPTNAVFAVSGQTQVYSDQTPGTAMNGAMIGQTGGNQPHDNMQPFLVCNWIISLFGVFPPNG
jgi:microcystin-dependent protein